MKASGNESPAAESIRQSVERNLHQSTNCAQTAFRCLEQRWGLQPSGVSDALSYYPCGTLFLRGTCGAALGCMMAMGLLPAEGRPDRQADPDRPARVVEAFCRRLVKQRGGINCRDILKSDPRLDPATANRGTAGQRRTISDVQRCIPIIEENVRIALALVAEQASLSAVPSDEQAAVR